MKTLYTILCIFALTSCATVAPLTYQEHCAVQGMKFTGVRQTSGTTSVYAQGSNGSYANAYASSNSESIDCVPPQSEIDRCEIKKAQTTAAPKAEYNEGIGTKKFINGAAYVLYIIPGIVAKLIYDSQYDKAMAGSRSVASDQGNCN